MALRAAARPATPRRRRGAPSREEIEAIGDDWPRLAARWGVAFRDHVALRVAPSESDPPAPEVFARVDSLRIDEGAEAVLVAAPRGAARAAIGETLERHPRLVRRFAVAAPREIRRALIEAHAGALARKACRALLERSPHLSAARVPTTPQLLSTSLAVFAWMVASFDLYMPLAVVWTLFFLVVGLLRAWIADDLPAPRVHPALADRDLPRFAVLVPLYHEAAVLPALVAALIRLDYPADRLDLRLVVEADDAATRTAAEIATRGSAIEIVVVPPCRPRTKPKALNFALATVDAEFVTVYDAEDRPAPDQLRRAAAAFAAGDERLAVVQAALEIDHADGDRSWLVRQFEIEYAMLFHGLLPWLSHHRLLLPLGGTSNHFRRAALEQVGGWDPHNVTEDVDVALRLARAGFGAEVIASHTCEEAPARWTTWRAQRVRWLKGWLQTWFVHMRDVGRLHRELGVRNAMAFHLVLTGQLASAFLFAPSLAILTLECLGLPSLISDRDLEQDIVLVASLTAFASGILGALSLAVRVATRRRRLRLFDVLTMPLYWCAISVAAAHALVELLVAPSRWNKTSHGHAARISDPPSAGVVARRRGSQPSLRSEGGNGTPVPAHSPLASRPRTRL